MKWIADLPRLTVLKLLCAQHDQDLPIFVVAGFSSAQNSLKAAQNSLKVPRLASRLPRIKLKDV